MFQNFIIMKRLNFDKKVLVGVFNMNNDLAINNTKLLIKTGLYCRYQ